MLKVIANDTGHYKKRLSHGSAKAVNRNSKLNRHLFKIQRSGLVELLIDFLANGDRSIEVGGNDLIAGLSNHISVLAVDNELSGLDAETSAKHTVKRAGRAAALNVTENHGTALEILSIRAEQWVGAHGVLDHVGKVFGKVLVDKQLVAECIGAKVDLLAAEKLEALRHNDDGVMLAPKIPSANK